MYKAEKDSPDSPDSRIASKNSPQPAILRYCRCQDCQHHWVDLNWSPAGNAHRCDAGIGGGGIAWGSGKLVTEPAVDAWHYCAGYLGPIIIDDTWVLPKSQKQTRSDQARQPVPEVKAHVQHERVDVPVRAPKATRRNAPSLFDGVRAKQDVSRERVVAGRAEAESECAL